MLAFVLDPCPFYYHPSSGTYKLSVPLLDVAAGTIRRSPWHSVVAVDATSNYTTPHAKDVRDTHTLVCDRDGRPSYYSEKSPLWDDEACWGVEDEVVFEPVYPHGLLVYPRRASSTRTVSDEQISKPSALDRQYRGKVRASGFTNAATALDTAVDDAFFNSTRSYTHRGIILVAIGLMAMLHMTARAWRSNWQWP
ncbi:Isocyanide synthase xanB [Apiospora phragmitis]|uniref:Isocyanide synthase xanB n=1 Tax=Apiospora phragmitis TaxID=2905665 RepID=A0ABR1VSF9_9PEZI